MSAFFFIFSSHYCPEKAKPLTLISWNAVFRILPDYFQLQDVLKGAKCLFILCVCVCVGVDQRCVDVICSKLSEGLRPAAPSFSPLGGDIGLHWLQFSFLGKIFFDGTFRSFFSSVAAVTFSIFVMKYNVYSMFNSRLVWNWRRMFICYSLSLWIDVIKMSYFIEVTGKCILLHHSVKIWVELADYYSAIVQYYNHCSCQLVSKVTTECKQQPHLTDLTWLRITHSVELGNILAECY